MVHRLISQPKNYEWGVPGGISKILGLKPTIEREAEIWWGDHSDSNCFVESISGNPDFSTFLRDEKVPFPLLVKILAVQRSLSIQVHPDSKQATEGYASEDLKKISVESPDRTFKDTHAKPELLIALSEEFSALSGFLTPKNLENRMENWIGEGVPGELRLALQKYAFSAEAFVRALLHRETGMAALAEKIRDWLHTIRKSESTGNVNRELSHLRKIFEDNPEDDASLFAAVMNHVTLKQGEALFVPPKGVHAYLSGFGLEIMLPSDNVIRAGLTSKSVSIPKFLDVADLTASTPNFVKGQDLPWGLIYEIAEPRIVVRKLTMVNTELEIDSPSICIVERGSLETNESEGLGKFSAGSVVFATSGTKVRSPSKDAQIWLISSS